MPVGLKSIVLWAALVLPSWYCSSQVLDSPEVPPSFPGGMESFYAHVNQTLRYQKAEGKVFLQFVVETSGEVSEVKVVKGIDPACDEEAIRVLTQAPNFIPGSNEGKPVRSRMILPILFAPNTDNREVESITSRERAARSLQEAIVDPNKTQLVLKFRQLKTLAPTIGEAKQLRFLDLSGNHLERLPVEIGALAHLEELFLTYNGLKELPSSISLLQSLRTLYLDRNDLEVFPTPLLELQKLETLDLSYTRIKELPIQVADMPNLKFIYARGTLITSAQIQQIRTRNPNLELFK